MADPFSVTTGVFGLIALALQLVVGALGMIDKAIAAHDSAEAELKGLRHDLENYQTQMVHIHRTLEVLATNTKDRAFKRLLQECVSRHLDTTLTDHPNFTLSQRGQAAIQELCSALDAASSSLKRLTDRSTSNDLQPAALPANRKSLEFVRAVFRHNLSPSKITDIVGALQDMRSDVQMCSARLGSAFQHAYTLYEIMNCGLVRTATRDSMFSTSTSLTIRLKLVDWLEWFEVTQNLSVQRKFTPVSYPAFSGDHNEPDYLGFSFVNSFDPAAWL